MSVGVHYFQTNPYERNSKDIWKAMQKKNEDVTDSIFVDVYNFLGLSFQEWFTWDNH